jgi:cysteinyl-tRNA synthetase
MLSATRALDGQDGKRNPVDFALWKKAQPEHIMRWPSPWSDGFPGWHCECTAMGKKYLGEHFDIHGGGMDLIFPHHECEIAQAVAAQDCGQDHNQDGKQDSEQNSKQDCNQDCEQDMVRYWMHNNMITINGQKMGKSLGNFITLEEFFTGSSPLLTQAYTPMTIRFFILQAHYRSTVDFSNEALQASEKGLERLLEAYTHLNKLTPSASTSENVNANVKGLRERCEEAICDDLNSPIVISHLFDASKAINTVHDGNGAISVDDLNELQEVFKLFIEDILGLKTDASASSGNDAAYVKAVDLLLSIRRQAKENKDWATSDRIRKELESFGFKVKDTKDGVEWSL